MLEVVLHIGRGGGSVPEGTLDGTHRVLLVAVDDYGAIVSREFDSIVGVMSDHHELGEGGIAEDGAVGQRQFRDVEVDEIGPVVGASAEGDRERYLADRRGRARGDPGKGPRWLEAFMRNLHLVERVGGEHVQPRTAVDERPGNGDVADGGGADEWELTDCMYYGRMVRFVEGDGVV